MRAAGFLARRLAAAAPAGRRGMSSVPNSGYPHGMHFHVSSVHKNLALAYGTMFWLWIFWRAKNDGKAVLGLEHPWEHGHGGHDDHSAAAEMFAEFKGKKIVYEREEIGALPSPTAVDIEEDAE